MSEEITVARIVSYKKENIIRILTDINGFDINNINEFDIQEAAMRLAMMDFGCEKCTHPAHESDLVFLDRIS